MKILIIAYTDPAMPLAQQYPELARIATGNTPTIISGPAVSLGLVERTLDTDQFEVIHIVGHGSNKLLQLLDGPVTIAWLIRRLRAQRNLRMCFFNSCDSAEMGAEIHTQLQVVVIAQRPNLGDAAGANFAYNFYGAVSRGASYNDAFYEARASNDALFPDELHPLLMDGASMDQTRFQTELVADVKLLTVRLADNAKAWDVAERQITDLSTRVVNLVDQIIGKKRFASVAKRFSWILLALALAFMLLLALFIWHTWL
jgi:hypothetical protein